MIIFIDESGDAGFKIQKGSSEFFVIALVIFDDELEAEKTAEKIKDINRILRKKSNYEIKFNKLERFERITYLKMIKSCKFRIRSVIVQKEHISPLDIRIKNNSYYTFFLGQLLKHNKNTIKKAKLRIDGSGKGRFKNALTVSLRQGLNKNGKAKIMSEIKLIDSKSSVLIQLTDMVAGSIHRYYQRDKNDSEIYRNIIRKHIEEEWIFE